jgi:hypothetical protein
MIEKLGPPLSIVRCLAASCNCKKEAWLRGGWLDREDGADRDEEDKDQEEN